MLSDPITNPVELHVHALCAARRNGVSSNTNSTCVVAVNGSGWLSISVAGEYGSQLGASAPSNEECSILCFCNGCHNNGNDSAERMAWAISGGQVGRGKVEDAACD